MAPPSYPDLGKSARDLFGKGYNFGFLRVDSTTKAGTAGEVEFKTNATHSIASGKMNGSVDVKYKIPKYGMTLVEKWTTENLLGTLIEVQDQFGKGLKVVLDSTFAPQVGKRTGKLKAEWCSASAKVNADLSLDAGPLINLSGVAAHNGWLFGVQSAFDAATSRLKGTNIAFGRINENYALHSYVNNLEEFGASLFHRINPNVELGAQLGWREGDHGANFGLAAKYAPSKDLEIRAKVNNNSQVAVATTHALTDQVKLILSTQFGLTTLNEGGHKFGLGLEYIPH